MIWIVSHARHSGNEWLKYVIEDIWYVILIFFWTLECRNSTSYFWSSVYVCRRLILWIPTQTWLQNDTKNSLLEEWLSCCCLGFQLTFASWMCIYLLNIDFKKIRLSRSFKWFLPYLLQVFVPMHLNGNHWALLVLNFKRSEIQILNSIPGTRNEDVEKKLVSTVRHVTHISIHLSLDQS